MERCRMENGCKFFLLWLLSLQLFGKLMRMLYLEGHVIGDDGFDLVLPFLAKFYLNVTLWNGK